MNEVAISLAVLFIYFLFSLARIRRKGKKWNKIGVTTFICDHLPRSFRRWRQGREERRKKKGKRSEEYLPYELEGGRKRKRGSSSQLYYSFSF